MAGFFAFLLPIIKKSATILLMNTVKVNAHAKLNLTLDLIGRAGEYHLLDSLVTTIDLFDRIVVKKRRDRLISVVMHGMGSEEISPETNNAQRAGEAFLKAFQTTGADITIYKNIPIGAGLGGSSADAAGVLNALSKLYGIIDRAAVKALADSLGSDTGYLLTGGFARMRGRGEQVESLGESPKLNFFLLCPKSGVSTAECYRKSDEFPSAAPHTERVLECIGSRNLERAAELFSNGLYDAAKSLNPDVETAIAELRAFSPWGASMTGSGSGTFAVFETMELCQWAKSRYRGKYRAYCLKAIEPKSTGLRNPFAVSDEELNL